MKNRFISLSFGAVALVFTLSTLKAQTRLYSYRMEVEYMWSISRQSMRRTVTVQAESALEAVRKTMEYRTRSYYPVDIIKLTRLTTPAAPFHTPMPEDTSTGRRR